MKNLNVSGAKVILLSKLRLTPLSSSGMMQHLDSVGFSVSRMRVHKIIKDFESAGMATVAKEKIDTNNKAKNKKSKREAMVLTITKFGKECLSAYLDTEIGNSIDAIKERVAATITDEDKATLRSKIFDLESSLSSSISDIVNADYETEQCKLLAMHDKHQLIALENCCIESRKWLDKC